jgi:lantibiotic modifying enzyme
LISWATNAALGLAADQRFTDVTHGAAGLGLALLDLWDRTGDPRLAERVADIADRLVSDAVRDSRGVGWLTGGDSRTIGFGHGLAGVSTFLAEAAGRFGHAGWAGVADEAVNTLVGEAVIVEDCARWRLDFSDRPTTASWWCHGTGGVVIPLVRAPHGVVDEELLRACGQALVADRWQVGLSYCHGLAGSAEALLDLDDALPGQGWGFRAAELLALAWTRRTNGARGELILGDPVVGSVPDFGVGHSGLLTVLLRLRHGGTRALLPTGNLR